MNSPISVLKEMGFPSPVWAREVPEKGFTRNGAEEWRFATRFLSTDALIPLAHLIADGWSVIVDRAKNGLIIRLSKRPL